MQDWGLPANCSGDRLGDRRRQRRGTMDQE